MLAESIIPPYDRNDYRKWKQWDRSYNMEEMWPKDRYPEAVTPWMYYAGCFVTSLAIMLKRFGVVTEDYETFNPLTLCERIKSVNGFDKDGAVIMECLDRLWPIHYVGDIPYTREALIETLESGMACQLMVRGEAAEYHYLVPDEILEDDITVCDCAWPKFKVSDYPEVLYITRYEIRKKNKSIKIPFFFEGVTAVYTADDRAVWSFKNGGEESKENFRRLSEELSLPEGRLFHPLQVHGAKVQKVTDDMAGDGTTRAPSVEADGAVTNVPGLALCLIQSDCAPVYFYDPEKRAAGLCHSGRKGTQLHIAAEVIKTMKEAYGTDPEDLFCVIGPHICGKCYEVGKDVAEEFAACFPEEIKKRAVLTENGRITLDLSAAIRSDLLAAGVREDRILRIKECTYENRQLFSYRRGDGVRSDLSAIVIR